MKIKVLNLLPGAIRSRSQDVPVMQRNPSQEVHPFQKPREITRAINAAKLERLHARPFVSCLSGHADGISAMAKNPQRINTVLTAAMDGEIRTWNIPGRCVVQAIPGAHDGWVRGLALTRDGSHFVSVGDDKMVKIWNYSHGQQLSVLDSTQTDGTLFYQGEMLDVEPSATAAAPGSEAARKKQGLLSSYATEFALTGVDTSWGSETAFATSGTSLQIWDVNRSTAVHTFEWGAETINTVKYNGVQTNLLASSASDRGLALYDVRQESPVRKLILAMRSNAIAWNPMEAMNLTVANEDHNCYTFDMRKLDHALVVHKDHVSAVMSLDYSPTGREFVTGSYDKTVRIFGCNDGKSRDMYHTKRMQRIFSVLYTMDTKYVLSGSDDTNVRIWRADATANPKPLLPREAAARAYNRKLTQVHKHVPQVRKLLKSRIVPKNIAKATSLKKTMAEADARKESNRIKYSKQETTKKGDKKDFIVAELK